jgi:hypothetical protein
VLGGFKQTVRVFALNLDLKCFFHGVL